MRAFDRRQLLWLSAALAAGGGLELASPAAAATKSAGRSRRAQAAFEARRRAAARALELPERPSTTNGDEERYPERWGSFTKGLPHDVEGRVDRKAYEMLLRALRSGKDEHFEAIPLGGFTKLANPQAALSYELVGPDGCQIQCDPAPALVSEETAAEAVELYWQALLRDVPFSAYGEDPLAARAAEELTSLAAFAGPRSDGAVVPALLFRGTTGGDLCGPYLSQFLWLDVPMRPLRMEQRIQTALSSLDYMTRHEDWRRIVCGQLGGVNRFDPMRRHIRNGRDLGEYSHRDFSYQPYLLACLLALRLGALPDGGNPYRHSRTQSAFTTFGQPFLLYAIALAAQGALRACWFHKWLVHRRLRPEEFGGLVHSAVAGGPAPPLPGWLADSEAVVRTRERWGTALLPQAFPEGCPTHPAYPAGHAAIAGACVTVLKACLDEKHVIPDPVVAASDGTKLEPWRGEDLTIGGELDKLAWNVSMGRNFGGIHWRSDAAAGLTLGEEIGIRILEELATTGNELFASWSLRRFDGSRVSVG